MVCVGLMPPVQRPRSHAAPHELAATSNMLQSATPAQGAADAPCTAPPPPPTHTLPLPCPADPQVNTSHGRGHGRRHQGAHSARAPACAASGVSAPMHTACLQALCVDISRRRHCCCRRCACADCLAAHCCYASHSCGGEQAHAPRMQLPVPPCHPLVPTRRRLAALCRRCA